MYKTFKEELNSSEKISPTMDNPPLAEKEGFARAMEAYATAFADSYNKREVAPLADYFATDVRFLVPGYPMQIGPAGVPELMKGLITAGFHSAAIRSEEAWGPVGDMASDRFSIHFFDTNDKKIADVKGLHLWKKIDGQWKLYVDCWNFDNDLPKP